MSTISLNAKPTAREQRLENEQELFKASGLTVREFCRRQNIRPSGFYSRRANSADVGARAPLVAPPELPNTAGFIDAGVLKKSKTKKAGGVKARAQTIKSMQKRWGSRMRSAGHIRDASSLTRNTLSPSVPKRRLT